MTTSQLHEHLKSAQAASLFSELYGPGAGEAPARYHSLLDRTVARYSSRALRVFSAPGRVELGGNHTDHNGGKVLAASVHLDSIAMVEPTGGTRVELISDGYPDPFIVELSDLRRRPAEEGRTEALIRGVAARLASQGYKVGGYRGIVSSSVLPGSGLSSSASIEILIGTIYSHLFNDGRIPMVALSLAGQFAENIYFGKPCGLMDQIACASGGVVAIDFKVSDEPIVHQVQTNFADYGYSLVVVDTGGSHADLTPDYAAIPAEMRAVAAFFGRTLCRELELSELLGSLSELRSAVGDRAVLRALHFFADNDRVDRQINALEHRRFTEYLDAVRRAGDSSWELLQNNYSPSNPREQGVPLALALSRSVLGEQAAVRIQGGGFAGTMQAYVPEALIGKYVKTMEDYFAKGCATPIRVRATGAAELFRSEDQ
ncbi:MAG TPA: galactokinase family protein [Spirochaetia bacterium]|nr:galactokinase family protein [Spirochaetia bacterium]